MESTMQEQKQPAANVPLFRQEALDHFKNKRQYGELLTISEPSFRYVAVVGVVVVALGVTGLFVLPYSRKVQVNGVITPLAGLKMIATPQAGIVTKSLVREGQRVKTNEVLFVVDGSISSTSRDIGESVARSIADTRRNLLGARRQIAVQGQDKERGLDIRIGSMRLAAAQDEQQIAEQQIIVQIAEADLSRHKALLAQGFVAPTMIEAKTGEVSSKRQMMVSYRNQKEAHTRELVQAIADLNEHKAQVAQVLLANEREMMALIPREAENEGRQSIVIKAPQDGTVTSITAESGQPVSPARSMARLIPDNSPLIVELYVSSRSAGFLKEGMTVKLAYQSYPFERYGLHDGKVFEIATSALANEEMALPGAQLAAQGEAGFRVRVMPEKQTISVDGIETALVPGMSVDARLVQEKRPLVAWLFAPLLTILRGL